jgi:hypothetical protein
MKGYISALNVIRFPTVLRQGSYYNSDSTDSLRALVPLVQRIYRLNYSSARTTPELNSALLGDAR